MKRYVVSLSGGTASAVAAERAIERYGRKNVMLWFADTSWEDEDLYRFIDECIKRWGGRLFTHADGRTPLDVAEEHGIIPNTFLAPCTRELKIKPFEEFLYGQRPIVILLGLDWKEMHRIKSRMFVHATSRGARLPTGYQARISGVTEDFPLMWKPYEFRPYYEVVKSWGITPPRLYQLGFSHNNCGGRCVKQGIRDWRRLQVAFPDRFNEVMRWEEGQRLSSVAMANRAILRRKENGASIPLPLSQIKKQNEVLDGEAFQDDMFSCICGY